MALAKKCDRCGKYYEENYKFRPGLFSNAVSNIVTVGRSDIRPDKVCDDFDMCDDCLTSFYDWFKEDKND